MLFVHGKVAAAAMTMARTTNNKRKERKKKKFAGSIQSHTNIENIRYFRFVCFDSRQDVTCCFFFPPLFCAALALPFHRPVSNLFPKSFIHGKKKIKKEKRSKPPSIWFSRPMAHVHITLYTLHFHPQNVNITQTAQYSGARRWKGRMFCSLLLHIR